MGKNEESLMLQEIRGLKQSIDGLTEAIMKLVELRREGELEEELERLMGSGEICIVAQAPEVEKKEERDIVLLNLVSYRMYKKLRGYGIDTMEKLIGYSRAELRRLVGLTDEMARKIAIALGELGLHFKGEKVYEPSDEVVESLDIERDEAILEGCLEQLGYPRLDMYDYGQRWVLEAMVFAMNNPKLSAQYKTYLWPVIAKREDVSVKEVTDAVSRSVKMMRSRRKDAPDDLAKKVFGYSAGDKRFAFEIRDIGLYARELRRAQDKGVQQ